MSGLEYAATRVGGGADDASGEDPSDELSAGFVLGEYVIDHKLGSGSFGAVYAARHPVLGRDVAIKVLHRAVSSNQAIVGRFLTEARAVNQIRHRNIIDVFGFGQLPDGRHYYVMEFLAGEPLDATLAREGRMSLAAVLPILRGIARALDAAHSHGIDHRDLKAENVYIARDGDEPYPKLLDFGIAKLISSENEASSRTRSGIQVGTPYAMAPEQCRGVAIDGRADVYALGVLTHFMLTGNLPFDGETAMDVIMKHMTAKPPTMSSVAPDLPWVLDKVVLQMLAKDPADRFGRATEAVTALEEAAALVCGDLTLVGGGSPPGKRFSVVAARRSVFSTIRSALVHRNKQDVPSAVGWFAIVCAFVTAVLVGAIYGLVPSFPSRTVPQAQLAQLAPASAALPANPPAAGLEAPALAPATSQLTLEVSPATAAIFIDGEARGRGTISVLLVIGKRVTIEARDAKCQTKTEVVEAASSPVALHWVLETLPVKPAEKSAVRPVVRPKKPRQVHSDLVNPIE